MFCFWMYGITEKYNPICVAVIEVVDFSSGWYGQKKTVDLACCCMYVCMLGLMCCLGIGYRNTARSRCQERYPESSI